ncbi:MAG: hypothetical protein IJ810_02075 [Candidatus Methanomethylophilus sp.]|nr:hypothetical protein [Methanomethylophilus sp.]
MIQKIIESQKEYGLPTFPEFISASSFRNSGIQFPTEADSLENSTGARLFARCSSEVGFLGGSFTFFGGSANVPLTFTS